MKTPPTQSTDQALVLKQLKHYFRQAALAELVRGICHEINNPLAVISATSQSLTNQNTENSLNPNTILKSTERIDRGLNRIIKAVKGMSLLGSRPQNQQPQLVDLVSVIESILIFMKGIFQEHEVKIVFNPPESPVPVKGSPGDISYIIYALLMNAKDAVQGQPNPTITITIDVRKDKLAVSVIDNGIGFEKNIHDKIFEPFFTTKKDSLHPGLGLTIASELIQAHNGELVLENPSSPTRFTFTLPT